MYKSRQPILISFPLKVVQTILAVVATVWAAFLLQMCQNTSNADTVAVIVSAVAAVHEKQTNMTVFFSPIVIQMQDVGKVLRPEQACWCLGLYLIVVPLQGQSNVSKHAFKGRQESTRRRYDALV